MERVGDCVAAVETAALVAPARDEQEGGDFYCVHRERPLTIVLVGDVMGKGESVAPHARVAQSRARECVRDTPEDPAAILAHLNTLLYSKRDSVPYVTACAVVIDEAVRSASWAFAGHVPPLWLDTGLPVDGATPALPLGFQADCGARSAGRRPLRAGEGFAVYTDGLEDVLGPGGDRFGTARVTHALSQQLDGHSPESIVAGLKHAACEFGDGELYDDLCIVALRLT